MKLIIIIIYILIIKLFPKFPFINPIYIPRIYSKIKNIYSKKNEYNNFFRIFRLF